MKNTMLLSGILILGLVFGCKKDDNGSMEPALQNGPPLSFDLIDVADGAIEVDVMPTLSWESAENPEGSTVTYDLYLGTDLDPSTLYESNITSTSFKLTERLHLLTDYFWKLIAKDNKGSTAQSAIFKFTTRNLTIPTEPLTADAGFAGRIRHTAAFFDDKIWVIGGTSEEVNTRNDVWYSSDGIEWKEATAAAEFPKRNLHTTVVFNNKLWVIGGYDGDFANDVWYSSDGTNWIEAASEAPFSARYSHTTTVFDDKIWVIGGNSEVGLLNDIWYSDDGLIWTEATNSADFSKRALHATVVFDNKLWLVGGTLGGIFNYVSDVWSSTDGNNWTQVTSEAFPDSKSGHELVVHDDKLWVMRKLFGNKGDMWFSSDGKDWTQAHVNEPLLGRNSYTTLVFDDKIWLVSGQENAVFKNDVWVLE